MQCPKCKNEVLNATKLEEGLAAHGCQKCSGVLISLLYYRDWAERTSSDQLSGDAAEPQADNDSKSALACPKCSRIMTKYIIAGDVSNKIDLCGNCDEAWLDGGEWALLKSLKLARDIPSVFTESWQLKVKKEAMQLKHKERYTRLIGDEDMEKVEAFRLWLAKNKHRSEILFYLQSSED